jgi:two-component system sensor histidine kinase KdpD
MSQDQFSNQRGRLSRWFIGPSVRKARVQDYVRAVLIVAACALIGWPMSNIGFAEANLAMIFLLGVVFVAARLGRGPSILASIASVVVLDYVYVPFHMSFRPADFQYLFTVAVMLLIALLISGLTSRVREQGESALRGEQRMESLYRLSCDLSGLAGAENLALAAAKQVGEGFGCEAMIFLPTGDGALKSVSTRSSADPRAPLDSDTVWSVLQEPVTSEGRMNIVAADDALFLPLSGTEGPIGVLAIWPVQPQQMLSSEERPLLTMVANQIGVALERDQLAVRAQSALVEAETERLRNSLLNSVSHDLRTPLAVITGASSALLKSDQRYDPQTCRELYQTIFDDSNRLTHLVDNLLHMTRIESGTVTVRKQLNPLDDVIGSAVRRAGDIRSTHVVTTLLAETLPLVPIDPVLIEQVLINLLENAGRYVPAGSPIEISARVEGDEVAIEVADRGPGLTPGDEERVFQKFYRGRSSEDGHHGAGLGLAICRAIVEAHGGQILAGNRAGGGATFRFLLPLAAEHYSVNSSSTVSTI